MATFRLQKSEAKVRKNELTELLDGLTGLNPDGYVNDFKLTEIIIQ